MILLSRVLRILLFHRFNHSQFSCKLQRCKMQETSLLDKPSKIRSVRQVRFENPYLWINWCLKLKHLCHGENSEDILLMKVNEICARSDSVEIETYNVQLVVDTFAPLRRFQPGINQQLRMAKSKRFVFVFFFTLIRRKLYMGASSRNGPPSARGAFFA